MLRRSFIIGGAALLPLAACSTGRAPALVAAPDVTPLKSFSRLECSLMMRVAGLRGVSAHNGVDCFRIDYGSYDSKGRPIRLSGLVALPRDATAKGLVSWQHGTTTLRTEVPSNLKGDGLAAAIVFGASGYAMTAPDYLGLGASPLTHTYYAVDDTARAVIDLLDAARKLPGVPDAPPFLTGFSQGAHASLAAQRELEAGGRSVLGTAPISGAFNLRTISLGATLSGGAAQHTVYLTYLTRGLAARYDQTLESALTPEVAALTRTLYDQPHKPSEIVAALPKTPRAAFNTAFLDAFDNGGSHWLLDALAANSLAEFTPKAPVRFFYGSADKDVSPRESIVTAQAFRARGADALATDVGPVDHEGSALNSAPAAFAWLETLTAARGTA